MSYQCIRNDLWVTLFPSIAIVVAALVHSTASPGKTCYLLVAGFVLAWLQVYSVTLSEQLHSQAEDYLNKPWRPLASGAVSHAWFRTRSVIFALTYLLVGIVLGAGWWCLSVGVISLLHAHVGLSRWWLAKNILPTLGLLAMLGAQWRIVAPLTPAAWRWMIGMFVLIVVVIHIQDLRDLEGDRVVGRRTLPMVLGDRPTRISLALTFLMMPLADRILMQVGPGSSLMAWACYAVTTLLCLIITWCILTCRGREADHRTYRYWEYWFTAMFLSMIFCL